MKTKQNFRVLSPDGFDLEMNKTYKTPQEVKEAINNFVKRFEPQGYYSTIRNGERYQMPIDEIAENCTVIPFDVKDYKVVDIEYDTDGEIVDLPKTFTFLIPTNLSGEDKLEMISDLISEETGFCHLGFNTIPKIK
jgi:hypothetical protein